MGKIKTRSILVSLGITVLLLSVGVSAVQAFFGIERVSVNSGGGQVNNNSTSPSISSDGRFVAFQSQATNLVSPATSNTQIFVRDRQAKTTTLVSADSSGNQGNGDSFDISISSDGHYVAFASLASNLVTPTTGSQQIFVRDRQAGTTTLVSADSSGNQGNGVSDLPSISADGHYIAFTSSATNLVSPATSGQQVFLRDRQAGVTSLVSATSGGVQGNNSSSYPDISSDGSSIAFASQATNLTNLPTSGYQIFVRDRQAGTISLVSVNFTGTGGGNLGSNLASLNLDGHLVAFSSSATNLVTSPSSGTQVFIRDRQAGTTTLVSADSTGNQGNAASDVPSVSTDGRFVAFQSDATNLVPGDTNGNTDVFVVNMTPPNVSSASVGTSLGMASFTTNFGSITGLTNIPVDSMPCSPGGYVFPFGVFSYSITNIPVGQAVTVTIRLPNEIPIGSSVFKCQNGSLTDFTQYAQQPDSETFIVSLVDGGHGDADGVANGTIVDPIGPAFSFGPPKSSSAQVPTNTEAPPASTNTTAQTTPVAQSSDSNFFGYLIIGLICVVLVLALVLIFSKRKSGY